jgi:hypothetical protein
MNRSPTVAVDNTKIATTRACDDPSVLVRLAALKTASTADLKRQWRDLFETEPPPFNRRYLESRLAYRIQELIYGGLKPDTMRRLERLGEELDGGDRSKRSIRADRDRPITGTRLLREWQGVEQIVTVTAFGFEWQGRPYKSLSAIARAITGTRWNGWVFFGLKNHRGRT